MKELFKQVNWLLQQAELKRKESLKRGERFNMFGACGVNHYENTHSAILAEMLSPTGSHGQGSLFLTLFLKEIGEDNFLDAEHAEVFTEFSTDYGRIDILIQDTSGHAIIIENKIYAADQQEQLIRYNYYANRTFHQGNYKMIYMTLNGEEASCQSAGQVDYIKVSYCRDVIGWINVCIEKSAALPLIRETLIQYRNHINQLTNQDMEANEKQELLRLMVAHSREVDALVAAQGDYVIHVFNTFVLPKLKEYSKCNALICEPCNLFESRGDRGIFFYRKEWKGMAICLWTDHSDEWDFYWGISNYTDCDMSQLTKTQLDCFNRVPNESWPYGWKFLDKYINWEFADGTLTAMIEGDFVKYVTEQVEIILDEIDQKNITML